MARMTLDARMIDNLRSDQHTYSLERFYEPDDEDESVSLSGHDEAKIEHQLHEDTVRIRQWIESLTAEEAGSEPNFAPDYVYAARYKAKKDRANKSELWEVFFFSEQQMAAAAPSDMAAPEIRLFSSVDSSSDGSVISICTGFTLPFAIGSDEEEAIYQRALAAANIWAEGQHRTLA